VKENEEISNVWNEEFFRDQSARIRYLAGRFGWFTVRVSAAVQIVVPKRWLGLLVRLWVAFTACESRGDTFNFSNTNYLAINDSPNPPRQAGGEFAQASLRVVRSSIRFVPIVQQR
jgi:hypothetical protein